MLIILGTCVAVVFVGLFVYWIIIKIKKMLLANQSNSVKGERQTPLTIIEDIDGPSLEQPLNEADYTPDIQRETDIEMENGDWLNNGVPEASASAIKKEDDDWLNAGVEEVPENVYKQQDDDWLNAENNQPLETVDESSLNRATTNRPEIQIKQDGSILYITVTAFKKQDIKSEQTVINLKINLPPRYLARKGEGPYDIEITTDDSSPSYQNLQDIITAKPVEEPVNQSHPLMDEINVRPVERPGLVSPQLMDEISIRPVENQIAASLALMDEINVRPVESLGLVSPQLMDEISIRPVENLVAANLSLMDEINVRPVERPGLVSPQLMDEISIRPVENQVTASHALMDEISIKPSPGPVNIEYELLDDLITKSTIYRTKEAKPSSNAVITNSVESSVEKAEPVKTICVNEITEILNEKRDFKQAAIPSIATGLRSTPFLSRTGEGMGNLLSQAKNVYKKVELRGALTKVLGALRIYNHKEFYIQDTDLTNIDTLIQRPQIKDFTLKVLNTATELDELIDDGCDLAINYSKIKHGLKKGMVAFLILVDGELASLGWACMTEESKATFRGFPYNDDLDRQACIVSDWTNPKFRDSGISSYLKHKRQQVLKENGFIFERSIIEESIVKDLHSMRSQKRSGLTYKRRTYTNYYLPGILGVEFWKERQLNETDTKPLYQMITLLLLVWPSPPMVAGLNIKSKGLKLNWIKTQNN